MKMLLSAITSRGHKKEDRENLKFISQNKFFVSL